MSFDLSGDPGPLPPTTAAGSAKPHDPKMVLLDEIVARHNEVFAGENFREDQERSWVQALVAALSHDDELVEQAAANTEEQFLASPTLKDAVTLAVADTNAVHSRMTDLFHSRGGVEVTVIQSLGRLLYLELAGRAA